MRLKGKSMMLALLLAFGFFVMVEFTIKRLNQTVVGFDSVFEQLSMQISLEWSHPFITSIRVIPST
jgi:hypothetical protein